VPWHKVTQTRCGGGNRVDEISTCEEHRKFPTGQLDVRDQRTGEWITLRPPDDKPSANSWVVIKSEMEDGRFFRYERPFGEFTRSVALPEGTDDVEARAHYANGVLEVHVDKREQSKPRRLPVTTIVEGGSTH
jgi:Hsp20/alpha crystallin family